jgi:hypothetical protein
LKSEKGTIAAIAASVAAYMEEERTLRPAMLQRGPVMVSGSWSSYGCEEMMRILWQRGIAARVMTFGCYHELKL